MSGEFQTGRPATDAVGHSSSWASMPEFLRWVLTQSPPGHIVIISDTGLAILEPTSVCAHRGARVPVGRERFGADKPSSFQRSFRDNFGRGGSAGLGRGSRSRPLSDLPRTADGPHGWPDATRCGVSARQPPGGGRFCPGVDMASGVLSHRSLPASAAHHLTRSRPN